jgi:hypothetical protein
MAILRSIRLADALALFPAAAGTLDSDDTLVGFEDGAAIQATPAQVGAGGGGGISDGDKGDVVVSGSGTVWTVEAASATVAGKVELATNAEVTTGTDTTRAITPAGAANNFVAKLAGEAAIQNLGSVEFTVSTIAASGATETLDTSVYGVFDVTMDQACTFTFSNPAPSGKESEIKLILRGAFTPTFPASVDWGDASAPTYTTPSVYYFSTVDAGTTWYGVQAGKAFG